MTNVVPLHAPDYRYRVGWWRCFNEATGEAHVEAYRTPWHNDWYDLYPMPDEASAAAFARDMAQRLADHVYDGGPAE